MIASVLYVLAIVAGHVVADQIPFVGPVNACQVLGCEVPGTIIQGTTTIAQVVEGTQPWPTPDGFGSVTLAGSEVNNGKTTAKFVATNPTKFIVPTTPPKVTPGDAPPGSWSIVTSTVTQVAGPGKTLVYETPVLTAIPLCATKTIVSTSIFTQVVTSTLAPETRTETTTLPAITSVSTSTVTSTSTSTTISIPPAVTSTSISVSISTLPAITETKISTLPVITSVSTSITTFTPAAITSTSTLTETQVTTTTTTPPVVTSTTTTVSISTVTTTSVPPVVTSSVTSTSTQTVTSTLTPETRTETTTLPAVTTTFTPLAVTSTLPAVTSTTVSVSTLPAITETSVSTLPAVTSTSISTITSSFTTTSTPPAVTLTLPVVTSTTVSVSTLPAITETQTIVSTLPVITSVSTSTVTSSITTTSTPPAITLTLPAVTSTTTSLSTLPAVTETSVSTLPAITSYTTSTITSSITTTSTPPAVTITPPTIVSTTTTTFVQPPLTYTQTSISVSISTVTSVPPALTVTTTVSAGPPAPSCIPGIIRDFTNVDIYQGRLYNLQFEDYYPLVITLLDAGYRTEQYSVSIDGAGQGSTSYPAVDVGVWCGINPPAADTCAIMGMSRGSFTIPGGKHTVGITNIPGIYTGATSTYSTIFYRITRQCPDVAPPIPPACTPQLINDWGNFDVYNSRPYKMNFDNPWPVQFTVVDAGYRTERYTIAVDGVNVGMTGPYVSDRNVWCGITAASAQNCINMGLSRGTFVIPAGAHAVTVANSGATGDPSWTYSTIVWKVERYCPTI